MDNSVVRQTAVFGIPHPKLEERPVVAVVLKDGYKDEVIEEAIISSLRSWFAK